jgi:D-threo-aldose 1-dehydrogenase
MTAGPVPAGTPLPTRRIGTTAVTVSVLGFGGAPLGNLHHPVDDDTAGAAVDAAWQAGIRYFDTAPHYGLGLSERRLGAALAARPRAEVVVSTKVGRLLEPNPEPSGSDLAAGGFAVPDDLRRRFDFSTDGVRRSLEASLGRLGTDRVDIAYVHDPDDHLDEAVAQSVPALARLKEQGVVGAVGVGTNRCSTGLEVVRRAEIDVVMIAGRWTLLDRSGAELLEECGRRGVAVVAAAPFNSGLLATARPDPQATFDYAPADDAVRAAVQRLADVCGDAGVPLPAAALQFPGRHPAVHAVVAGFHTPGQVAEAARNLALPIGRRFWDALA